MSITYDDIATNAWALMKTINAGANGVALSQFVGETGAKILLVQLDGVLTEQPQSASFFSPGESRIARLREELDRARDDAGVRALLLRINSPGGTTVGGEALHNALLNLAKKKPVVAVFSTVATSAAYMAGIASDHIIARGSSITGSVGVIIQWAEVTEMLGKLGIKMQEVRSGTLKAVPSPFRPLDDNAREMTQEMVAEAKDWFMEMVATRRSINPEAIPGLTEGRIYSGRQALKHKLIDELGGEEEAVAWLEEKRQVQKDLKIIDWDVESSDNLGLFSKTARSILSGGGLPTTMLDAVLGTGNTLERVQLDGMVSVWHAPIN